ncbi:restriction endonuclease subunit S [Escherichia coli]|uniref:restriction endonuclease subunit S n=1 Tax=Enterobacteriaceae TaxID=543 RepID=UPI000F847066|nr:MULTISPECIES: restriction endonuclease subunit S [Enterobacter cloacae complex]EKY1506265.1 restriction endonuclease subunit S [Enterobacter cloacae]HCO1359783.1 restriction endonuclease subunit S [Escherichia coli]HEQ3490035.1 restriction endonuclease subunit S [Raoultella ornithinolytica]MDN4653298.1 restriction endonuclease subunit S [Enterobacter cloacae complex sp. 2023EL-00493]MDP5174625.1 restriction endonuclease subunit S [Enterobacter hormaechei]
MIETSLPWLRVQLGDVVPYGKTEKCELSDVTGNTWVLELEDIEKDSSKIIQRLDATARPFKSTKNKFRKGDVLYGKLRPYLNKVVIADSSGVCSTEIMPLNAEPFIDNRYLFYWLKTEVFIDFVNSVSYGVNMPRLGTKDGLAAPFIVAPLAEQKVIADKLDTLLVQVDAIKARLERIPEILKTFRQSILTAAVSGKLTEGWRLKNKLSNVVVKQNINLPKLTPNEHYLEHVEGWQWVRLGSVVSLINGDRGKNYPNKNEYVKDGIPFINTGHINSDGTLSDERMNFISKDKFDSLSGGKTKSTDLVYCLRGATMGKTARVHYKIGAIASSLVIIRPSDYIDRDFAYYFLISPPAKDLINEFDNGSAQPNLSAKSLSTYPLQLPSFKEQIEIVSRVEEMFNFSSLAEAKAKTALERVNKITQSILAKAFRGELTADWRAANPDLISEEKSAEALLEKIKAEREAIEKQLKPTRSVIKKNTGGRMSKQIIKVVEALKQAGKPLSGQQLLAAAGYPSDSSTEQLEQFFLDIRDALTIEESIVKLERGGDSQDWFALANNKAKN